MQCEPWFRAGVQKDAPSAQSTCTGLQESTGSLGEQIPNQLNHQLEKQNQTSPPISFNLRSNSAIRNSNNAFLTWSSRSFSLATGSGAHRTAPFCNCDLLHVLRACMWCPRLALLEAELVMESSDRFSASSSMLSRTLKLDSEPSDLRWGRMRRGR